MRTSLAERLLSWTNAVILLAVITAPFAWAVITSLKPEALAVSYPPVFWPTSATLENYAAVLASSSFLSDLWNSVVYSLGAVAVAVIVGVPAGYAAARFHFYGKQALMLLILGTSMVPGVALLVPTYILLDRWGLLNNSLVLVLILSARLIPQTIWFIHNFVEAVPLEVEEAGLIDGANRVQVVRRLVLPLIRPGIAAVAVMGIITTWNDYVTVAAFAPQVAARTVQVALVNQVFDAIGISWSYFMAFAVVASIPVVLIFMLAQRWFVAGLTAGAVKG